MERKRAIPNDVLAKACAMYFIDHMLLKDIAVTLGVKYNTLKMQVEAVETLGLKESAIQGDVDGAKARTLIDTLRKQFKCVANIPIKVIQDRRLEVVPSGIIINFPQVHQPDETVLSPAVQAALRRYITVSARSDMTSVDKAEALHHLTLTLESI
jgi:hypothetical protein